MWPTIKAFTVVAPASHLCGLSACLRGVAAVNVDCVINEFAEI